MKAPVELSSVERAEPRALPRGKLIVAALGCLALFGCGPSQQQLRAYSFSDVEIDAPLSAFSDIFLKNINNLSATPQNASRAGFVYTDEFVYDDDGFEDVSAYLSKGEKILIVVSGSLRGKNTCTVAFRGLGSEPLWITEFFSEAQRRTGGKPRSRIDTDEVVLAYQLNNRSLFVYDTRKHRGELLHLFFVTEPVSKDDALDLLNA